THGLAKLGLSARILATLALSTDAAARRLALELATRLPPPLDPGLVSTLTPLLRDRRLPPAVLLAAPAARPCDVSGGRVSGHGYAIEVRAGLWWPRLRVESPAGVLFEGPEP